jgi:hypothetical protein
MTQVIIFTNENGGVSVTTPTAEFLETHTIEEVQAKDTPKGSLIVNQSDLPNQHNDFFDAWELADSKVTVSLAKAKEITKARLRIEREPLLAAQDVLYMRATEANQDTTAIVAEKQRLRDLPALADACTTLAQLRNLKA